MNELTSLSEGKRAAQSLRNLLRLPQAQRHILYEFFYSDIDSALFADGLDDFIWCMKEMAADLAKPNVRKNKLTKVHYREIRRNLGRPRRFSEAFLNEERFSLNQRRETVRVIQSNNGVPVGVKVGDKVDDEKINNSYLDADHWRNIPRRVPGLITVGTRVDAVVFSNNASESLLNVSDNSLDSGLTKIHTGLYTGTISAVDTMTRSYRVTFDKDVLGTRSVLDTDLRVCLQADLPIIDISSQIDKLKQNSATTSTNQGSLLNPDNPENSDLKKPSSFLPMKSMLQGYTVRYLTAIHRYSELLNKKQNLLKTLQDKNSHAKAMMGEKYTNNAKIYNIVSELEPDFQKNYNELIFEIVEVNEHLQVVLKIVREGPKTVEKVDLKELKDDDTPEIKSESKKWSKISKSSQQVEPDFNDESKDSSSSLKQSKQTVENVLKKYESGKINGKVKRIIEQLGALLYQYNYIVKRYQEVMAFGVAIPPHEFEEINQKAKVTLGNMLEKFAKNRLLKQGDNSDSKNSKSLKSFEDNVLVHTRELESLLNGTSYL